MSHDQISVTLPDGSKRVYPRLTTGTEIATSIGAGLAKAALALKVDGRLCDLAIQLHHDCSIEIVTKTHPDALELIRHDFAHIMAEAVQELYPGTQVTIGPAIENGFYYDFARDESFTPDDLEKIETKMREIIKRDLPFVREVWDRERAISFFKQKGELFKVELIQDLPGTEDISIYRQGDWLDLCRGPHVPSTGKIGTAFKLMKIAGAYWRGDHTRPMLQRIYATAWRDQKELDAYLLQLEEAEKRDHRRLGREMDLFHLQEESVGNVFWHPKGWTIWRVIERYLRTRLDEEGYQEVRSPQLIDRSLWEASGHWDKFRENMFTVENDPDKILALKPMNCPGHVQIFKQGLKSYRDLPLKLAEFGCCHRNEPSGGLHGIMRVRGFVQDDAHIFCRDEQITEETIKFCQLLKSVYQDFGFTDIKVKFSDRPEVRGGTDEVWDKAEGALREAIQAAGLEYSPNPGEGAFYGPKLEFVLRDAIGRDWQCGTFQVDYVIPERLDATYIAEDGSKKRPVMLHRAILGSIERFIGVLIENYAGKLPLWLAPVQCVVTTITGETDAYAKQVADALYKAGLRVELDTRNEKINYKIREHSLKKIPVILVVGKKEAEAQQVVLRYLGQEQQETLAFDQTMRKLQMEAKSPLGDFMPLAIF